MKRIIFMMMIASMFTCGGSNYWDRIYELAKYNTPTGNPRLEAYLKSLSPSEMLQVAREYSKYAETNFSEECWAAVELNVIFILPFYGSEDGGCLMIDLVFCLTA